MNRFPYSAFQIEEIVQAEKYPRDWEPIEFTKGPKGNASRVSDIQLLRMDGKADRIRLVVRAGDFEKIDSYAASLLLENTKIRGIDFHPLPRSRKYKIVYPAGWHHDIVDPNLETSLNTSPRKDSLEDFEPYDLIDFLKRISALWNISLPSQNDYLL